jgi:hypothetical protein
MLLISWKATLVTKLVDQIHFRDERMLPQVDNLLGSNPEFPRKDRSYLAVRAYV